MTENALAGIDMASLLGTPESNPVPASPLEKELVKVDSQDAAATTSAEMIFSFRSLLDPEQLAALKEGAPALAERMIGDYNAIISFGDPVLEKLNAVSSTLLEQQRAIELPEAEKVVNDVLAEINGYSKKYRNDKMEDALDKIKDFFSRTKNTFRAMVNDAKPIDEKLIMAEAKLKVMELALADNVERGTLLHKTTLETLQKTVAVLAALEEIQEVMQERFQELDKLVATVDDSKVQAIEYNGKTYSGQGLKELHADYAATITEFEKTFSDWRSQFFINFGMAPTTRNIILVSATMQRRCKTFRTMGIPSARTSLAMWQQAALAKEAATSGKAVQEGTNTLIQGAFDAAGKAVAETAMAAQTPVINEDTIWTIVDSIKAQCDGLVAADKWGREQRAKNIAAMQQGEAAITTSFTDSRRQLAAAALKNEVGTVAPAPLPEADVLSQLGVK